MNSDWQYRRNEEGIGWLHFDLGDSPLNLLSKRALSGLEEMLGRIRADPPLGLVLLSDKKAGFIAGADVAEFEGIDPDRARRHIEWVHGIFEQLESMPFATVAMIHGHCLGGGLELALACRYRVARDDPGTRLGFPEVRLGIFPGYGGTVRSIDRIGAPQAMQMMLTGRSVDGRRARRMGLVDMTVPERQLRAAARHLVLHNPAPKSPGWRDWLKRTPLRPIVATQIRSQLRKRVNPEHYPAPYALIDHWQRHGNDPAALYRSEVDQVSTLLAGRTARNLIRLFFLQERLRGFGREKGVDFKHLHVVGAGVMGGDIAAWCALKGLRVTLQDRDPKALSRALGHAHALFRRKLRQPRLVKAAWDRLIPDHRGYGIENADVVIEGIFEDVLAKQALFSDLEGRVRPDTLLASNTSSIPLATIGEAMRRPERLVGLHFFNPVAKMQLVEVVSDEHTNPDDSRRGAAFARLIDRLPLPVRSLPGFLVNRVLMPYLLEAMTLLEEGVAGPVIDKAAVEFGMPIGPVELADTVGLDICLSVAEKLSPVPERDVPERLRRMVTAGRLGRKSGEGFYRWIKGKPRKETPRGDRAPDDLTERLIFRLLNEAVAALREGVVEDADLVDAGIVFGTGFAPFRGGPMHYIHSGGMTRMKQKLDELRRRHGDHFTADSGWTTLGEI